MKVALITGASQRIGKAIACALHKVDFAVAIHYHHSEKKANALCDTFNQVRKNSAIAIKANLQDIKQCFALAEATTRWHNKLNLLINNASLFTQMTVQQTTVDKWDHLFDCNLKAPFFLSQMLAPFLTESHGHIINITDVHAKKPLKNHAAYCISKAALKMQTECLARELAPTIRVNAIAPGAIAWPEGDNALGALQKEKIIQQTPLNCQGDVSYIAKAVLSLEENPFITGTTLTVDGGRHLK